MLWAPQGLPDPVSIIFLFLLLFFFDIGLPRGRNYFPSYGVEIIFDSLGFLGVLPLQFSLVWFIIMIIVIFLFVFFCVSDSLGLVTIP